MSDVHTHAAVRIHSAGAEIRARALTTDGLRVISLSPEGKVPASMTVWVDGKVGAEVSHKAAGSLFLSPEQAEQAIEQLTAALEELRRETTDTAA